MKRLISILVLLSICTFGVAQEKLSTELAKQFDKTKYNFILTSDCGNNGYGTQKIVAETMGVVAQQAEIQYVLVAGDQHHFKGVQTIHDPLWTSNYEMIYTHPAILMTKWYPVAGNHEYFGNVNAYLDYKQISTRWASNGRYYTMLQEIGNGVTLRIVMIDTTPMIDRYRQNDGYASDAGEQDYNKQLKWIDSVLNVNRSTWTIVVGHHPVYAYTKKMACERNDMQARLNPILKRHNVDFYICGHIHSFQHIERNDSPVQYIVNSSACTSRDAKPIEGTKYCNGEQSGFTLCTVEKDRFTVNFIDKSGKIIYSTSKSK